MKKIFIIAALLGVFLPVLALAAIDITPSSYSNPANVDWTGLGGTAGCVLYLDHGDAPIASQEMIACGDTGNLNTHYWAAGTFTGTIDGDYQFVSATVLGCTGLSYAACAAANPGIPGANEADFTIYSAPTPTSTPDYGGSANNPNTPQDIFNNLGIDLVYAVITVIIVGVLIFALK